MGHFGDVLTSRSGSRGVVVDDETEEADEPGTHGVDGERQGRRTVVLSVPRCGHVGRHFGVVWIRLVYVADWRRGIVPHRRPVGRKVFTSYN